MTALTALAPISGAAQRRDWDVRPAQLFDRAEIGAAIAAAHARGLSGDDLRKEALALMRQALDAGRQLAREALEATGGGMACATNLSLIEDELIRALYDFIATYQRPPPPGADIR